MKITFWCQNSSDDKELDVSDSIPDILQTLSAKPPTSKPNQANVIVNELSDMEADLVDLNSPEHGQVMNNNQVNINTDNKNICSTVRNLFLKG